MAEREPNFSRMSRKKSKKDKVLNILIGIVVVLILIVGVTFILGDDKDEVSDDKQQEPQQTEEVSDKPILVGEQPVGKDAVETEPSEEEGSSSDEEGKIVNEAVQEDESVTDAITTTPSTDQAVKETVVDANWKPLGTKQTGTHVSKYDGESDDWYEKKQAIAYATGLSEDQLIYWRIQNGGSPQKAEGIVSSLDKSEKYKVYLEWVDSEGWKPVKMDVLNTLETK
ncbi:YrrS family protein [Sporosarcina obsidiansis]|uniref:YrrS family protein n=1 Tax=Sporosarcina obsidiansis TaxID=2660748 RepID=UPI00129B7266|nr:YrrS family protein [Sporosarcina obsidiansis]